MFGATFRIDLVCLLHLMRLNLLALPFGNPYNGMMILDQHDADIYIETDVIL